jgi:hypothetical protein
MNDQQGAIVIQMLQRIAVALERILAQMQQK